MPTSVKPLEVGAGNIGVAQGLKDAITGDTLCSPDYPVLLETISFPEPVVKLLIEPKTRPIMDKMSKALKALSDEDPTLACRHRR